MEPNQHLWAGPARKRQTADGVAQFWDQRNTAATLRATGESNAASEASYRCNRRETSEIQAKAYLAASHVRACAVYTHRAYCADHCVCA